MVGVWTDAEMVMISPNPQPRTDESESAMTEHHDSDKYRTSRRVREGALLAGVAMIAGLALVGCGSDDGGAAGAEDDGPTSGTGEGTLSITGADGTVYPFEADDLAVGCMGEGEEQRLVLARADLLPGVLAGDPPAADSLDDGPFLLVQVDVDQVPTGEEITLPAGEDDDSVLLFFVVDDGGPRANELTSDVGDASGTVTVEEASCGAEPRLEITVDALLGSEVSQGSLPMEGSYRYS